jgi:hypothetical protein
MAAGQASALWLWLPVIVCRHVVRLVPRQSQRVRLGAQAIVLHIQCNGTMPCAKVWFPAGWIAAQGQPASQLAGTMEGGGPGCSARCCW